MAHDKNSTNAESRRPQPVDDVEPVAMLVAAADLTRRLIAEGRQLYDFQYNWGSFGSWILVAGTSHRRVQVVWDGKESSLRVERFRMNEGSGRPSWEEVEYIALRGSNTVERMARALDCIVRYSRPDQ
jgi:hypothetical protein